MSDADTNPLLTVSRHPAFDCIRAEHARPAVERLLAQASESLERLEADAQPTWSGLMQPLHKLQEPLGFAWDLVHHYLGVMNSQAWRDAERALQPGVVAFSLRVGQSEPLFRAMNALRAGPEWERLSGPRRRILESAIRSARLSGVGLPPGPRERFNELQRELAELGTRFSNNLLDATKAFALMLDTPQEVEGLPASLLQAAAQSARAAGRADATAGNGPWRIGLDAPSFVPFMQHSRRRDLRERLYRAYVTRAAAEPSDNRPIIEKMLALRAEMAGLLGYRTFAELSLATKMAPDVPAVDALLEPLRAAARPHAQHDLADLRALAQPDLGAGAEVRHWDVAFWAERLRERRHGFNDEDLRPYFQFPKVLDGLFRLTEDLFAVRIEPADGAVPVWHPDVRFFRVRDADGTLLSSFYLDPYSRPETKRGGAWMSPAAPRERTPSGATELPVAYLACNQTLPVDGRPSLMTFREVETLFHEFGHALQHMLTVVDDPEASGLNNIEWDAVELASQFMENWCYHRATLRGLTAHVATGAPLPDELFDRVDAARVYRAGSDTLRQVYFALLDLELHHRHRPGDGDTVESVQRRIAARATVLPPLPEDRFLCGFSHIFGGGYAAGYYSYKWAEVLAADAFAAFEEAGLDAPGARQAMGRRYRETVLALGGGTHPMDVFRRFRGRAPDPAALLRRAGLSSPPPTANP